MSRIRQESTKEMTALQKPPYHLNDIESLLPLTQITLMIGLGGLIVWIGATIWTGQREGGRYWILVSSALTIIGIGASISFWLTGISYQVWQEHGLLGSDQTRPGLPFALTLFFMAPVVIWTSILICFSLTLGRYWSRLQPPRPKIPTIPEGFRDNGST